MLRQLHPLSPTIVNQHQAPVREDLAYLRGEHQRPTPIHQVPFSLLFRAVHRLPDLTVHIPTRPPHRVHSVSRLIPLHHAVPCRETHEVLRERNRILPELPEPGARHRHEIHLHVLQGNQHGFNHRRRIEQFLQLVERKPETWVHVVVLGPPGDYNSSL